MISAVSVVHALEVACQAHPSQRVAQVIVNALGRDPFYMDNEEARERLYDYARKAVLLDA